MVTEPNGLAIGCPVDDDPFCARNFFLIWDSFQYGDLISNCYSRWCPVNSFTEFE
jgi:hypothetical protein